MAASDDIRKAFAEAFAGINKLIDGQVSNAKNQGLTVSVSHFVLENIASLTYE